MVDNTKTHPLNTSWCLWYHNPVDKKWDLGSYTKIYEISTIEDFWVLFNNWDKYLPCVSDGMYFLMRKFSDEDIIYPLWEDKHNVRGGFWSFKMDKSEVEKIWLYLSVYLIAEKLCINENDVDMINGISISPKKNFCILKIWNNCATKCDLGLLNNEVPNLDFSECMYKCHNDNIANDKIKLKKYKSGGGGGRSGKGGFYKKK